MLGSTHHAWLRPSEVSWGSCRDIQVPQEAPAEVAQLINDCLQPNPALRPTAAQLYCRIQVRGVQLVCYSRCGLQDDHDRQEAMLEPTKVVSKFTLVSCGAVEPHLLQSTKSDCRCTELQQAAAAINFNCIVLGSPLVWTVPGAIVYSPEDQPSSHGAHAICCCCRPSPAALCRRCSSQRGARWPARCWGRTTGSDGGHPPCKVGGPAWS